VVKVILRLIVPIIVVVLSDRTDDQPVDDLHPMELLVQGFDHPIHHPGVSQSRLAGGKIVEGHSPYLAHRIDSTDGNIVNTEPSAPDRVQCQSAYAPIVIRGTTTGLGRNVIPRKQVVAVALGPV
jgi:hypothetical protein